MDSSDRKDPSSPVTHLMDALFGAFHACVVLGNVQDAAARPHLPADELNALEEDWAQKKRDAMEALRNALEATQDVDPDIVPVKGPRPVEVASDVRPALLQLQSSLPCFGVARGGAESARHVELVMHIHAAQLRLREMLFVRSKTKNKTTRNGPLVCWKSVQQQLVSMATCGEPYPGIRKLSVKLRVGDSTIQKAMKRVNPDLKGAVKVLAAWARSDRSSSATHMTEVTRARTPQAVEASPYEVVANSDEMSQFVAQMSPEEMDDFRLKPPHQQAELCNLWTEQRLDAGSDTVDIRRGRRRKAKV